MAATETTVLPTSRRETPQFPVFVDWVAQPVDASVATNGLMLWVDQDNLEELEHRILPNPVRVENTKSSTVATCPLLQRKT